MADTVRHGDHYRALGLTPAASAGDIEHAFRRAMRGTTLLTAVEFARISVAFETLRDPTKRQAYDALLREQAGPKPALAVGGSASSSYGSRSAMAWNRPRTSPLPASPQPAAPKTPAERPEPPAPFIASRKEEIVSSAATEPEVAPRPATRFPEAAPSQAIAHGPLMHSGSWQRSTRLADEGKIRWKPVALAVGMPALGIALFGAIFGLSAAANVDALSDVDQAQAADLPITVPPPPTEERYALADFEAAEPERQADEPASQTPTEKARLVRLKPLPVPPLASPSAEQVEIASLPEANLAAAEAEPSPAAQPAAANLPLPNRTIASTIGRIGYPCGAVASSAAVDGGAPGVFKITCTSGHSYQASPVNGRYRFRRWREQ